MSENRLNAYLKAKGIEPKGDDTDYVIGTGFTRATKEWAEANSELAQWMIPGGAAVWAHMNNSDDTTGAVTGGDPSEVEPIVDENIVSTPEDIANVENPEEVTVDATSEDAVNAISDSVYYNNININGEA